MRDQVLVELFHSASHLLFFFHIVQREKYRYEKNRFFYFSKTKTEQEYILFSLIDKNGSIQNILVLINREK